MADVLEHGRERSRRRPPMALVAVLAAVLLVGGAVAVLPRALRDDATSATAPSPTPSAVPTTSGSAEPAPEPVLLPTPGPVDGPRVLGPTGVELFVLSGTALMRLDGDSRLTPITGAGDVSGRSPRVTPWGDGQALLVQPPGVDPETQPPPATVYLIAQGSTRARRVGSAHRVIPGSRPGEVVFLTDPLYDEAQGAVTYDSSGVRRTVHRIPRGVWVASWAPEGPVLQSATAAAASLQHPVRTAELVDRIFVGVTSSYALTLSEGCNMEPPCTLEVTNLRSGATTVLGLPDGYLAYAEDAAFSPSGQEALVYTHDYDVEHTVGDLVHVDLRTGEMRPVPGASAIGAVTHLSWTGDGSGAFFASGGEWVHWSRAGGIELIPRRTGVTVVGVA